MTKRFFAAAAAAALLCSAPVQAQQAAADTAPRYKNVFSANPLGLLLTYYNAEYERAVSDVTTVGVSGAYFSSFGDELAVAEAKVRYYPQARTFAGFSMGASVGFGRIEDGNDALEPFVGEDPEQDADARTAFIVGIELDYNWLVGRDRRFFIGTGIGARRLFGGDVNSSDPVVIPTLRLVNVGFAF